ncbi:hypothetical protein A8C75_16285 [Marinobacterium aestuarii]|uniref:Cytochrome c domain-containing protein n=2 Tax=Marinobacterium aestuarii TaxID=1821621 RepID=A0A1A9F1W7_9GAMM|nr:hypothetical protein A8C75_16285 [Marinobacterium aestuarii]
MVSGAKAVRPKYPSADTLLYAEVIRPPEYRLRNGLFTCRALAAVDENSVAQIKGLVQLVVRGNFVALVARDIQSARLAARKLALVWADEAAADAAASSSSRAPAACNAESALAEVADGRQRTARTYGWPNRLRWGNRPGWVMADARPDCLQVWAPSQTPGLLQRDLAALLSYDTKQIEIFDGSRSDGVARSCADDAAADAALLSQAVGQPVAVWLSPAYQPVVAALGQAQRIDATACWSPATGVDEFEYQLQSAANSAPVLAMLLVNGGLQPLQAVGANARALYDFGQSKVRQPGASTQAYRAPAQAPLQDTFARESFVDELARDLGADPVAFRRDHLTDARGRALIDSVAQQAQWTPEPDHGLAAAEQGDILRGRGFAYAHSPADNGDAEQGTRSAWVADIEVNRVTGEVLLNRIVVGQDSGAAIDQEALREQLQREMLEGNEPLLLGQEGFDQWGRAEAPDGTPAMAGLPVAIDLVAPPATPASGPVAKPGASMPLRYDAGVLHPAVAVIANALYNATGIRFREPPFAADRIRAELAPVKRQYAAPDKSRWRSLATVAVASSVGVLAIAWPWKGAIEPISRPAANLYSAATIERGRLVAAAGDCVVCHTDLEGAENVGGRAFDTPFGTLYSTNLTPDEDTGIGRWSFEAFDRAMRQGISRDGRNLYPAFPYTAFAKISESDMQALYAYLMAQPAVRSETPQPEMSFPFSYRPLMAGWNTLFHDPSPFQPDPARSELWNRGAYLAEGLGHCSACHTPRNAMGAEKSGADYFSGALVDGWEAPALNSLSKAPVPWTEDALYDYLRFGASDMHGVAAGPMAPVVAGLAELPEQDVRAIAHYVASYSNAEPAPETALQAQAELLKSRAAVSPSALDAGQRVYEAACAACHTESDFPSFTDAQTSLALNSNLHSSTPDNVIQTILYGVQAKQLELPNIGAMPGFKDSLSDQQITSLVEYLRLRFGAGQPGWQDIAGKVAHYRAHAGTH